jgi:hypothetical protein
VKSTLIKDTEATVINKTAEDSTEDCIIVSQRRLEQVPKLIILTNSRSFENLKLKRKEKKRRREHIIYNKYNVCAR